MKIEKYFRSVFAVFLAAVMVLCTLPQANAATSAELKEQLKKLKERNSEIQADINRIQKQYDANASEIKALVEKKNGIDQEISLLHEEIININDQIRTYGQLIADSQEQLDAAEIYLTQLNVKHKERIRAMEEQGTLTYWQVIFQSRSFTDLLDRVTLVDEIAAADAKRMEEMRVAYEAVQTAKAQLSDEREGMEDSQELLQNSEKALDAKREESDAVLRELIKKQDEFEELLEESEAKQDALMVEIGQKQRELANAEYREELVRLAKQGNNPPSNASWRVPVSGYTITSAFGYRTAPTAGASTYHQGVDLACPEGTPIYATRGGTVTAASFQSGGAGYYVSINHGDGFGSIYMHMTRYVVSVGTKVSQGQLIGYVGNTGVSTGPHLHFGISYGGIYVNPMAYI